MVTLEGIQFVTDTSGKRTAVILDLDRYGEIWEDIYAVLIAQERENEPQGSLEEVKRFLISEGKLDE